VYNSLATFFSPLTFFAPLANFFLDAAPTAEFFLILAFSADLVDFSFVSPSL
ncbi:unnamed protein product, partial [Ceratitis capitata]